MWLVSARRHRIRAWYRACFPIALASGGGAGGELFDEDIRQEVFERGLALHYLRRTAMVAANGVAENDVRHWRVTTENIPSNTIRRWTHT